MAVVGIVSACDKSFAPTIQCGHREKFTAWAKGYVSSARRELVQHNQHGSKALLAFGITSK